MVTKILVIFLHHPSQNQLCVCSNDMWKNGQKEKNVAIQQIDIVYEYIKTQLSILT